MTEVTVFFGYPGNPPALSETMREAARKIASMGTVKTQTWEDLKVSGALIIDSVLEAIDSCTVAAFEITTLNHNVMFEFGYAVGRRRRIWPLFDQADAEAGRRWHRLRLLTTVGYAPYINSDDVRGQYLKDSPHLAATPLFDSVIQPTLQPQQSSGIFYVKSNIPTDASRALTRRLGAEEQRLGRVISADPTEAAVYPLSWYAQQAYNANVTVAHLSSRRQVDSEVHNARSALIAGLAHGMGRKVLVVAEADQLVPIDYRDLSCTYETSKDLVGKVDTWLGLQSAPEEVPRRATRLELETELQSIHFGEPVAENESQALGDYFIETANYREVLRERTTVFVGRKGAGKSANFLQAADELSSDARNLVCVIQPSDYELEAVVRFLAQLDVGDEKSYAVEALWQYLLLTEIAGVAARKIREKPVHPSIGTPEAELLDYVDDPTNNVGEEFAVRLERIARGVGTITTGSIEETRASITTSLHGGELQQLRRILGEVLNDRERVCVLIDNLDKAWDKSADLLQLSHLLLGLLTAVQKVDSSFQRRDAWRRPARVTLAVFLRSDIYEKIANIAKEPDKIPISRLIWTDRNLLLRVVEERYRASHPQASDGELWERYFPATIGSVPMKEYVLSRVLPRPRDLVHFCGLALTAAVNAGHSAIEATDITSAERLYSQFAFEALLVENGLTVNEIEDVLLEFAGGQSIVTADWAADAVRRAGLGDAEDRVIARLRQLSFLGVETKEDVFAYEEDARDEAKFNALARNLQDRVGRPARYEVHPAYRPYLEIEEISRAN